MQHLCVPSAAATPTSSNAPNSADTVQIEENHFARCDKSARLMQRCEQYAHGMGGIHASPGSTYGGVSPVSSAWMRSCRFPMSVSCRANTKDVCRKAQCGTSAGVAELAGSLSNMVWAVAGKVQSCVSCSSTVPCHGATVSSGMQVGGAQPCLLTLTQRVVCMKRLTSLAMMSCDCASMATSCSSAVPLLIQRYSSWLGSAPVQFVCAA